MGRKKGNYMGAMKRLQWGNEEIEVHVSKKEC
jgi:hypothetical protein